MWKRSLRDHGVAVMMGGYAVRATELTFSVELVQASSVSFPAVITASSIPRLELGGDATGAWPSLVADSFVWLAASLSAANCLFFVTRSRCSFGSLPSLR